ncbi:hypothetical protein [Alkalibacterium sp.]|nr:MAG: hypothetical protein EA249_03935 [Alkalibacterium sp.]
MKKETAVLIGILLFIVLVTTKLWIKATLELQLLGLVALIVVSFYLKKVIMKKLRQRVKHV